MQDMAKILKMDNLHILQSILSGDKNLLNWQDEDGNNLLIVGFNLNLSDEIIGHLIKHIDFNLTNSLGISPFSISIRKGRKNWVEYMIQNGVDLNHTERESGFTPIMESITSNREDILRVLLENGGDIRVKDKFGFSALDFATRMKKRELLKILVEFQASEK